MTEIDVSPARAHALSLLEAALSRRAGLEEASSASPFMALDPRQRGFARALVLTTLRRLATIDRALDAKLQKPPPETVRNLLRLGAAQLWFMDTPDFAAVDTTVGLAAGRRDTRPFKNLVNAVLRALAREGAPVDGPLAPDWLLARWRSAYGDAAARAIAEQIPREPPGIRRPSSASASIDASASGFSDRSVGGSRGICSAIARAAASP